ncbi:MAG: hypothetical protein PHP70_01430 [Gallionella sp.]|nr:hypothetical protein [Gallionella sp.]
MNAVEARLTSIQSAIVRLTQTAIGKYNCYATPSNGECGNMECILRKDCFDAARELFPPLRMPEQEVTKLSATPAIPVPEQTGSGQDAGIAKPANGERANKTCPLRATCNLPSDYCSKGHCEDWFF